MASSKEPSGNSGAPSVSAPSTSATEISDRGRWYIAFVCFLAFLSAAVDRHILGLLVEPMQRDLGISDTGFGLLAGAGFVVFYLLGSLPAGHLVDTRPRSALLAGAVFVWSMATSLTAFCSGILQLAALRAVVGLSEAMVSPATSSIVSDLFHKRQLARAMSLIGLGSSLGAGLILIVAAALFGAAGAQGVIHLPLVGFLPVWQSTFLIAGLPGIALALLILLTVREPPRRRLVIAPKSPDERTGIVTLRGFLRKYRRLMLLLLAGYAGYALINASLIVWLPGFFLRVYDLELLQVGLFLGLANIAIGLGAWLVNSSVMDAGFARGIAASPLILARNYAWAGLIPAGGLIIENDVQYAVIICIALLFLSTGYLTVSVALARLLPNEIRGKTVGLYMIGFQIIGGGGGPLLVGLLSDLSFPGEAGLGMSLGITCTVMFAFSAVVLSLAIGPYRAAASFVDRTTSS